MKFLKIPNFYIFVLIYILFFLKILLFFYFKDVMQETPSDAHYYNDYALGYFDVAVNVWPVILSNLNNLGLYNRDVIAAFLLFLNLLIIPVFLGKISEISFIKHQKYYLYLFLLCLLYPTLYFYTFDVYRDVFMVFSFLTGCLIVKKSLDSNNFLFFIIGFILALFVGYFLYELRPYLGYAFLGALFLWKIKFTKKRILIFGILYLIVLFVANYLGLLEQLTEYRSGFDENAGGSTLGLDFSNPVLFIPNFILSLLGQLFGLYITNPVSLILFFIETCPFICMLIYIIKNINLADNFVRFVIVFFILYASVWLIGNDNLGTAVRLRMYNYFAVYICFFYILRLKTQLRVH